MIIDILILSNQIVRLDDSNDHYFLINFSIIIHRTLKLKL